MMMMKMFMPVIKEIALNFEKLQTKKISRITLMEAVFYALCFQSMPKMPESESKEETAESIAEKKEQERLKLLEAKQKEKERNEKYSKLKSKAKDDRKKYREKYKLNDSPTPSDEEDISSDEEDAFGPKKAEKVEEDPVKREPSINFFSTINIFIAGAKQMAEKAMTDPMSVVNNMKFW